MTEILTDAQIEQIRERAFSTNNPFCPVDRQAMRKAARAILNAPEIKAALKDAARYQWLRNGNVNIPRDIDVLDDSFNSYVGEELDRVIDDAMQGQ